MTFIIMFMSYIYGTGPRQLTAEPHSRIYLGKNDIQAVSQMLFKAAFFFAEIRIKDKVGGVRGQAFLLNIFLELCSS